MTDLLAALIGAALINNLVLGQPVAADALHQARVQSLGRSGAATLLFAAPLGWLLQQALGPSSLSPLFLLLSLLLLAALASTVLAAAARWDRPIDAATLWPLLVGNGLGAVLLARPLENLGSALLLGLGGGLGFWLVLTLLADLLTRCDRCDVPAALRGTPLTLIVAGLMGLALLGFNGMARA